MRGQVADLDGLEQKVASSRHQELRAAIAEARQATASFVAWLEEKAPSKTGPSGIGKENYTWSQQHVHLAAHDLGRRGGDPPARAGAGARVAQARGGAQSRPARADRGPGRRRIPAPRPTGRSASSSPSSESGISTRCAPTMDAELRAAPGRVRADRARNFFAIATHYEPLTLYTHSSHWWDLARMRDEPHPSAVRRGPLLYNIWDARSEGMATAMEELMLHAGLFDDEPRAREIVWIMLAQRAARGLASLYLAGQRVRPGAGQGLPGRMDAARLDAPRPRPPRLRAAALPAPAGLRHELHHRQGPARGPDARAQPISSATPSP